MELTTLALLNDSLNATVQFQKEAKALERATVYMELSKKAYRKFSEWILKYRDYEAAERQLAPWTLFMTHEEVYNTALAAYEAHRRCDRVKRNILFNIFMNRI